MDTLSKGIHVLEALALSERPRGVTELAAELGLVKSNVHRIFKILEQHRLVRQDEATGRYECTLKLWELGSLVAARIDVKRLAAPHLKTLAARTSETVHLSVLDGNEVLYIDKIDSPQPVRAYSEVGGRAPANCVATGKALLAFEAESRLAQVIESAVKYTPRTLTTLDALVRDLARVRDVGYAVNRGEWRDSVCGLAAPIFDASERPIAAIGISGPIQRLTPGSMRESAPLVIDAARAISRELGFTESRVAAS